MSALSAAASDEDGDEIARLRNLLGKAHALNRIREQRIVQLTTAINRLHAAKGRYHTQLAVCDLFDLVGLKTERPK